MTLALAALLAGAASAQGPAQGLGGLSSALKAAKGLPQAPPAPAPPPVCAGPGLQPARIGTGERLLFRLDVLGAEIGTFEMRVQPSRGADRARGAVVVEARGKSSDLVSTNVRRIEGRSSALIAADGRAVRYREELDEGDVHRSQEVDFPARDGNLSVRAAKNGDPDEVALGAGPEARDLLSGLFVLRRQPLTAGGELCAEIYAARRMWRVEGKVAAAPENVETPLGRLEAVRIDAVATRLDDAGVVRKAHVWITTDERRLPIAILGEVRGRYIRAQLAEAKVVRPRRTARR